MARIRWHGTEFTATPIKDNGDGTWRMRAEAHTARTVPGTEITVKQGEIVEMAAAEVPTNVTSKSYAAAKVGDFDAFLAADALEAAMAAERETLPSVRDVLAKARKDGTLPRQKVEDGQEI